MNFDPLTYKNDLIDQYALRKSVCGDKMWIDYIVSDYTNYMNVMLHTKQYYLLRVT